MIVGGIHLYQATGYQDPTSAVMIVLLLSVAFFLNLYSWFVILCKVLHPLDWLINTLYAAVRAQALHANTDFQQQDLQKIERDPDEISKLSYVLDIFRENSRLIEQSAGDLKKQKDYLQNVIDHIPDLIFLKDRDHHLIGGNKAFWTFLEGPAEKFIGKNEYDFFPKSDVDIFWERDDKVFNSGGVDVNEDIFTDTRYQRHVWSTKKAVFFNEHGDQILVGISRDITAAKDAEKRLQDSENKLRAVMDNVADGLISINQEGVIESFNPACERMFGYSPAEIIGQNIKTLIPEPFSGNHDGDISTYLKTGELHILGTAGREVKGMRKNGVQFPMEISISSFELGGERHFSGTLRDITSRKKAEEERNAYLNELESSNRELDDFAYVVSHDLKEPLRGLQSFSRFLLEDYEDKLDEEGKRKLHTISDLTKRLESILDTLLYYSRLGRTAMSVRETDMNDMVRNIIDRVAIILKEKNATVEIREKLPVIVCDHVRIAEVFQNLICNAIKYNDSEGANIKIGCMTSHPRKPEETVFYVMDNGIGIPGKHLETVFKIFKRLHAKNAYGGGSGSGLAIAKKIINQHGGDIWAEPNGDGQGSTFFFTVPPYKK